jgi:hypothetical protein
MEGKDDFDTQHYCEEERDCPPPLPPKTLLRSVSGYGDRLGILNYSYKKDIKHIPYARVSDHDSSDKRIWILNFQKEKNIWIRILRRHRWPLFTPK